MKKIKKNRPQIVAKKVKKWMGLPPVSELERLFLVYNAKYFESQLVLKNVDIDFSSHLTSSGGNCRTFKNPKNPAVTIRLSTHYCKKFPNEIPAILLHEMIHAIRIGGHGWEFMKKMNEIKAMGGYVTRHTQEKAILPKNNWEYTCAACGTVYKRTKRLNPNKIYTCGKDKGKLIEVKL